ncbi:hypothetical protein [Deinococcus peraridilitoris]|uniref:Uncharacterized protein n=1 Tax=Deinococcus peraridilitoris (strain DSM 19664 / LMG 22246 / CIP 109416 / KR-200) TaxID=937777 RepID=K9ZZ26_DEIPD|nr:hypothetical protein [Deinococcus peraridilitoris]AFZ66903.1 hypothetical protein Deipe_1354 [Deinococcus peraridilitoris DSM 19664]
MKDELVRASPASRRKRLLFVVGIGVMALACWKLPGLLALPTDLSQDGALALARDLFGKLCFFMASVAGIAAAWSAVTAWRILRTPQWPLPGALVGQDTLIRRGRPVYFRAYGLLVCAAVLAALAVWAALLPGRFVAVLFP